MRRFLFGMVVIPLLLALVPSAALAGSEGAAGNHEKYTWVVGATTPSDTAMAPDGSTISMTGHGLMQAGPGGSASGGGSFAEKNASGAVVSSGTFNVTDILGFVSYGSAAAQGLPAALTGGEAKLHVSLSNGQDGTLTIFCVLGNPPPSKMEGIQVILGDGVSGEYTDQDGGNTVFIDMT